MLKSGQPEVEAAARSCHNYLQLAPDNKNKITIQLFILLGGGVGAYPSFQGARCGVHPEQVPRMSQGLFTHKPLVFLGPSEVAVLLLLQCDWSLICSFRINAKCCHEVLFNNFLHFFFFSQNENLRSSRDAPHSSSMSDMAISPLSLFSPVSPTDSVFWDSVETPPKVSIICF